MDTLPAGEKSSILEQMKIVIDKDLEVLAPEERTLERWFSLLENEDEFAHSKYKLLRLKNLLEELNSE